MRNELLLLAAFLGSAATLSAQTLPERLDSAMRDAERRGFSGVVRVEQAGTVLLERGYGMADRAAGVRFTPNTVVQIGSNTKDFTAVAVLKLQAAGQLSLSDSLPKYFANVPADKRAITIRQLLNHRGGFPLGIGGDFEPFDRARLVDSAMKTTLLFEPGTRESYSNTGYSLLAAIIERVTGKTYDVHIRDAILTPTGLTRTGFLLPGFAMSELAHGYNPAGRDEGTMLAKPHAADGPYWNLRGNGGMLSTVPEMAKFYRALFDGETLLKRGERAGRFNPEEPVGLAGSDGINVFLYDRFPPARTEILIASTNAAMKAGVIRTALGDILGLPNPDNEPDEQVAKRPGGRRASSEVTKLIESFVTVVNRGEAQALRDFITTHFVQQSGGPTVDERVERITRMHENLGTLTVQEIEVFADGPAEVRVRSSVQGVAVLKMMLSGTPPRIASMQVLLGG